MKQKESYLPELLKHDDRFRYMMLNRMQLDCKYYLGYGGRNAEHALWAQDEQEQIDCMRGLLESFDEKPEWISMDDINEFARQMGVN